MRHNARAQMTAQFTFQEKPWPSHLGSHPCWLILISACCTPGMMRVLHDHLAPSTTVRSRYVVPISQSGKRRRAWPWLTCHVPSTIWLSPHHSHRLMFSHSHIRLRCQGASIWLIGCGVAGFQGSPAPPPAYLHSAGPAVLFCTCPLALSHWGPGHGSTPDSQHSAPYTGTCNKSVEWMS